jgi:thiol-disulfide isomerase/thioredoxin
MEMVPDKDDLENSMTLPRLALVLVVLCMAGLAFAAQPGEPNLSWKGTDFSGAEVDFPSVLQDKPTVLIFWASWCPYTKAFMPYLGEIQKDYGTEKIHVLAIDIFETGDGDPAAFLEALDFPVIAVANGDSIAERYSVRYTPGLFVLDGQGNVIWRRASTDLSPGKAVSKLWDGQVREQLDQLL